jgi:anaerobic selenocysteine-containing dehydrogenase
LRSIEMTTRRNFLRLGAVSAAAATAGGLAVPETHAVLAKGGKDYSSITKKERQAVPSACWQCVSRCPIIGYVEDGKLAKIGGQFDSIRTHGALCAKAQAGINQIYDPDRVLHPMRRVGARGEGKWKRISWDEALDELAGRLKKLRDDGHPEKFMFHYGRMKASSSKLIKSLFLSNYGTGTVGNHTAICEAAKWTAQELTWGSHYDNWDFDNTRFVLNFGSNCLEAHTNHTSVANRLMNAMVDRNVRMVTFDVRLSNTAAKSSEWVPIKPGTDMAVVLAMSQVIMSEDLYRLEGIRFLEFCRVTPEVTASTEAKVRALTAHLKKYTPEWAEEISGVPADKIRALARELALARPACVISYRGARHRACRADARRHYRQHRQSRRSLQGGGRQVEVPQGPEEKTQGQEVEGRGRPQGRRRASDAPCQSSGIRRDQGRWRRSPGRVHVVLLPARVLQRQLPRQHRCAHGREPAAVHRCRDALLRRVGGTL